MRALKMNMLFNPNAYDNIMDALNMPPDPPAPTKATPRRDAFYAALASIPGDPLVLEEKDWLWNYLQMCNANGFGGWSDAAGLPEAEAASSGW